MSKIMSARQAVELIQDGDTISTTAGGMVGYPEAIAKALEVRYVETGSPKKITVIAGCGHGKFDGSGDEHFAYPGLLKRYLGSHPNTIPKVRKLVEANEVEGYVLPQGIINQMYRVSAAKQAGILSKIGMNTYVDPRQDGGKMNDIATEDLVDVMTIGGEEYLFYKAYPINVAIIRGTTADVNGNVTIEEEALNLELLETALAAKATGGKVIVQVKYVAAAGTLDPKAVIVPGKLVDAIVVSEEPMKDHLQTNVGYYDPYLAGQIRKPAGASFAPKEVLEVEDAIVRRAVFELRPGAVLNVGVGIGARIGGFADIEGIADKVMFTLELGAFGGTPKALPDFGVSFNVEAFISHPSMFDFYHGGGLDIAVLGAAQVDAKGNVNVSKFNGQAAGQGGFIDISQTSKKTVFCTTFNTKGFKGTAADGKLTIEQEGGIPKFVAEVDQITFNGPLAVEEGREVVFITERGVFKLEKEGITLTEVAPGVDVEKDIIPNMGFRPVISPDLKVMDARIFAPGRMGCFDD